MYKMQLTLVTGPLSRLRFIPMSKHESESTYICMDNTRISEKTFSVPLGFGVYLLTIDFYFYSNDYPTPPKGQQNRFSERRFSEKKTISTGWMGKRGLSANK